ncbi:TRAP transporter substrate-binding protein DctP [Desulfotalea psychrophila]|uniref:Probable DctP (Periplasmic C4-dicarboxylate binding protein) n=1 Tax=Desulfotalea psychrophila (strain LSv54 / DSM 12343) TaxID=177439 RepID=Q6ARD8_DESPS|nr:TRAP transporter substrate-binding protein DctP [Desulfotalea psychrophila]CAG35086.1 probable DctP (periplasmic C4-dicarboxylate binding protein) [Desulfotalea psychrophila LSv54]
MKHIQYIFISVIILLCTSCSEKKDQTIILKYIRSAAVSHFSSQQMQHWSTEVEQRTAGRVKIIDASPAPLSAKNPYDSLIAGTTDIAIFCTTDKPDRFPVTNSIALPFGFADAKTASAAMRDLVLKYAQEEFSNTTLLTVFTGAPSNFISIKPIKYASDLKNISLGIPKESTRKIAKEWGTKPLLTAGADMTEAMEKGRIEGVFTSLAAIRENNLAPNCKFITLTNQIVSPFAVVMNQNRFTQLPADIQKILQGLFVEQSEWTAEYIDRQVQESVKWAVTEHNMQIIHPAQRLSTKLNKTASNSIGLWAINESQYGVSTEEILATLQDYIN